MESQPARPGLLAYQECTAFLICLYQGGMERILYRRSYLVGLTVCLAPHLPPRAVRMEGHSQEFFQASTIQNRAPSATGVLIYKG